MTSISRSLPKPLVSAIIPSYNRAHLCARAVRSALEQVNASIEVIVVDDGSTDDTRSLLEAEFESRVQIVWQPNQGVSAARNSGIARASGEFIAFLDSDDQWLPHKTERQLQWLLSRPEFGMVLCDLIAVDADGKEIRRTRRRDSIPVDGDILEPLLSAPYLVPSSAMIRRSVIDEIGGFDTTLPTAEDLDFHLRVAARHKIGLLEEHLVLIGATAADGLSALHRTNYDYVDAVLRFLRSHGDLISLRLRERALFDLYRANALSTAREGRTAEALSFLRKAMPHLRTRKELIALCALAPEMAKSVVRQLRSRRR